MYAFVQDVPIGTELYWKIIDGMGREPLPGQLMHLCVRRADGGLRYIDVWASQEACDRAFDERIHAAVDGAFGGKRPATEPTREVLEIVHATGALLDREVRS
jgi:hypothetical protein